MDLPVNPVFVSKDGQETFGSVANQVLPDSLMMKQGLQAFRIAPQTREVPHAGGAFRPLPGTAINFVRKF